METGIRSSDRTFAVSWPIQPDILNPLLLRLTSRNLLDLQPAATNRVQIVSPRAQGPGWSGAAPDYITYLLPLVTNIPSRSSLRASSNGDFFQPRNERRIGDRAIPLSPHLVHGIAYRQLKLVRSSIATFRRHLKSYLSHTMESPTDN